MLLTNQLCYEKMINQKRPSSICAYERLIKTTAAEQKQRVLVVLLIQPVKQRELYCNCILMCYKEDMLKILKNLEIRSEVNVKVKVTQNGMLHSAISLCNML